MTLINSSKLPLERQVRAALTRAFLLNSALIEDDLACTVDRLTALVLYPAPRSLDRVFTRLHACLIALDEGIKLPALLAERTDQLDAIIRAEL